MRLLSRANIFAAILLLLSLSACVKASNEGTQDEGLQPSEDPAEPSVSLRSNCGIFKDGAVHATLDVSQAEPVTLQVLNSDLVIVTRTSGQFAGTQQLVQLQGITAEGASQYKRDRGIQFIQSTAGYNGFLVVGGNAECSVTVDSGGTGVIGQIFGPQGENINESLIAMGAANVRGEDGCGGAELEACYRTIAVPEEFSQLVLKHFLWKPSSANDGNLVIGVDQFVTVKVSGAKSETQKAERYAGAPYVSFVRFRYPGCEYGGNIKIEFFDELGLRLKTGSGAESVTVASGCSRDEQSF